jgi:hypothetical protein
MAMLAGYVQWPCWLVMSALLPGWPFSRLPGPLYFLWGLAGYVTNADWQCWLCCLAMQAMQAVLYAGSLRNMDMLTGWLCRQFWLVCYN